VLGYVYKGLRVLQLSAETSSSNGSLHCYVIMSQVQS